MRLKVKGNKDLVRDTNSQAIINTDNNGYNNFIRRSNALKRRDEEIRDLQQEMNEIKNTLNLILEKL
jgi:hypothetical protein